MIFGAGLGGKSPEFLKHRGFFQFYFRLRVPSSAPKCLRDMQKLHISKVFIFFFGRASALFSFQSLISWGKRGAVFHFTVQLCAFSQKVFVG